MVYPPFQRILKERMNSQLQQMNKKVGKEPSDDLKLFCICFRMESFMNSLQHAQLNVFYKELDTLFTLFQREHPESIFKKEEAMQYIEHVQHNVPGSASKLAEYILQFQPLKEAFFNFSQISLTPHSSPIHMYESDGI